MSSLPRPHHPVFNVPQFARASQDRFFLCIEATDPLFDPRGTAELLAAMNPHGEVIAVPRDRRVGATPLTTGQPREADQALSP